MEFEKIKHSDEIITNAYNSLIDDIENKKQEITRLEGEIKYFKNRCELAEKKNLQLEQNVEEEIGKRLKRTQQNLISSNKALTKANEEYKNKLKQPRKEIKNLKSRIETLVEKNNKLISDNERAKKIINDLISDNERAKKIINDLLTKCEEQQKKINSYMLL